MEYEYIKQNKRDYTKLLIANGDLKRAEEVIMASDYEPILKIRTTHKQAEPCVKDINENTYEIYRDLCGLTIDYRNAIINYYTLMKDTKNSLDELYLKLQAQKEYHEAVNILCNKYTDFNNVIEINENNLLGDYTYNQGIISAKIVSSTTIDYDVIDIKGNGYEGNKYVYYDNDFVENIVNTSNPNLIKDKNNITIYEYSRLTANNNESFSIPEINFDSEEAECSIFIYSEQPFNNLKITCSSKDTILKDLAFSSDGIKYLSILKKPIYLYENLKTVSGATLSYLPNSGLLCFPDTQFLKITLQSNGITDDKIAFYKTTVEETSNTYEKNTNVPTKYENIDLNNQINYVYNQSSLEIEKSMITTNN